MTPFLSFAITPLSLTPTFSVWHKGLLWGCKMVSVLTSWTRRSPFCWPERPCRSRLQQTQGSVCWSLGAPHKPGFPAPSQWEQTGFQRPGVWHLAHLFPAVLVQKQKMPSLGLQKAWKPTLSCLGQLCVPTWAGQFYRIFRAGQNAAKVAWTLDVLA